jgi:predicted metal-dependent TIM-barrel fold hydrolase
VSDPFTAPKTALEMKRRGCRASAIDKVVFPNPQQFLKQCSKFEIA